MNALEAIRYLRQARKEAKLWLSYYDRAAENERGRLTNERLDPSLSSLPRSLVFFFVVGSYLVRALIVLLPLEKDKRSSEEGGEL